MVSELKELFTLARKYGRVRLGTCSDGKYFSTIEFETVGNIELNAKSGYNNNTPEEALAAAIAEARTIVGSMENTIEKMRLLNDEG